MTDSGLHHAWYAASPITHSHLSFVSYNCQALPRHRPLFLVLATLAFDIIALQSTCETWGWVQRQPDQMFYRKNVGDFHIVSWPRSTQHKVSKVSGVLLAFRRQKLPATAIKQVHSPDGDFSDLLGRAGAVRLRLRNGLDMLIACMYLPPPSTPFAKDIAERIWMWSKMLISNIPQRCTPLFLIDANARLEKATSWSVDGIPLIGSYSGDRENSAGKIFRKFIEDNGLTVLNSFNQRSSQSTWLNTRGHHGRIDYILTFANRVRNIQPPKTLTRVGFQLQLPNTLQLADHVPVASAADFTIELLTKQCRPLSRSLYQIIASDAIAPLWIRDLDDWALTD